MVSNEPKLTLMRIIRTMKAYKLLISVLFLVGICGCSNDQAVYAYVVSKSTPKQTDMNTWRPVMRVAYRVSESKVVSDVAGCLDEFQICSIYDKYNWECEYEDGTGINRFGFLDGKYWKDPGWGDNIKYVSRWEYNLIRCKWHQFDNGIIRGTASCLQTFI